MTAYCDTSFLVSLYAPDAHSSLAARTARGSRSLIVSSLGELELINALQLRVFRNELTPAEIRQSLQAFLDDLSANVYSLQAISPAVFEAAKQLSRTHSSAIGARSLDILHVAAALQSKARVLYTFDGTQKNLAVAVGLQIAPGS